MSEDVEDGEIVFLDLDEDAAGGRLDKALAAVADLSRSRLQALIAAGALSFADAVVSDPAARASPGRYALFVTAPEPAEPEPQDIPLSVLYEDGDLVVLDKPAGMPVHPAPGWSSGTLVNALLHHCRGQLSGIGGVARPGIVHRLDKDTSGVMVAAKSDRAHQGLARLFAAHDIERAYVAFTRGAPTPAKGVIETRIGRSPHDRKKMAIVRTGGRTAVTHYELERPFGVPGRTLAARVRCRLQTGRTHQIRVHLASKGSPCLGDPLYGVGAAVAPVREAMQASRLTRQALHAAVLGFVHPTTGASLRFETALPDDMRDLEDALTRL